MACDFLAPSASARTSSAPSLPSLFRSLSLSDPAPSAPAFSPTSAEAACAFLSASHTELHRLSQALLDQAAVSRAGITSVAERVTNNEALLAALVLFRTAAGAELSHIFTELAELQSLFEASRTDQRRLEGRVFHLTDLNLENRAVLSRLSAPSPSPSPDPSSFARAVSPSPTPFPLLPVPAPSYSGNTRYSPQNEPNYPFLPRVGPPRSPCYTATSPPLLSGESSDVTVV